MRRILSVCLFMMASSLYAETKLRFAHAHPESDSQHRAAVFFADEVAKQSNGSLKVLLYPNGQLGNDQAMIAAVRSGAIDLELSGNPYFTGMVPEINALDVAFLFADSEQAYAVLDGDIGRELLGKLDDHQLKGLAFWEIGFRNLTNNERPVKEAGDIKGLKLRTTPNPVHLAFFSALGANPVPMPFAEVYTSLETRTIDGQENPVNLIKAANLDAVQKYLSLTEHAYTAAPLVMNFNKFNSLSEQEQQILLDAAREAADYQRQLNAAQQQDNLAALQANGMQVEMHPDREGIKAAAQQAMQQAVDGKPLQPYLQRIEASLNEQH